MRRRAAAAGLSQARVYSRIRRPPTGFVELNAAFAALAEYLAERDRWTPQSWIVDAWVSVAPAVWSASTPSVFRDSAFEESSRPFRDGRSWFTLRGIARP